MEITIISNESWWPYTMNIWGKNKITLQNILIGDVWLCAGQSNMEHQLKLHSVFYPEEIAKKLP